MEEQNMTRGRIAIYSNKSKYLFLVRLQSIHESIMAVFVSVSVKVYENGNMNNTEKIL
jgi:hypothetical protein